VAGTGSAAVETDIDFLGALALGPAGTLTTTSMPPIGGPGPLSSDSASRRNMNL
jgi:hypothetical protein